MPSLRERSEDIPLIAQALLDAIAARRGQAELSLDPRAGASLRSHSWPGNIRELRNVLERAALVCRGSCVRDEDLIFDTELNRQTPSNMDPRLPRHSVSAESLEPLLGDEQWRLVERLFPSMHGRGGQWKDHRTTFEGILWVLRSEAAWRELPAHYGPWQTIYDRFQRWQRDGTLELALERLGWRFDQKTRKLSAL